MRQHYLSRERTENERVNEPMRRIFYSSCKGSSDNEHVSSILCEVVMLELREQTAHVVRRLSDRFQLVIGNDISLLPLWIISDR